MGKLKDVVAKGDPLDPISIVAFANDNDAFKFVQQGFSTNGLQPAFNTTMRIGDTYTYGGSPYAVFSYFENGLVSLLSITQLNADLPILDIGSWGAQITISRGE
jgi:hypothetical protein